MRVALAPELAALEEQFVLVVREVTAGGRSWRLERPRSADDLINEADFERDERLPYWADLWPSAIALADAAAAMAGEGRTAIEFGCGLGLPSLAALQAGFDVTATDYYADALRFARRNAMGNLGRDLATRLVDWGAFPADLGRFDLVLASDVLYERRYAPLVARAVVRSLSAEGVALVADPGRPALRAFLESCEAFGAVVRERHAAGSGLESAKQMITLHEVRLG